MLDFQAARWLIAKEVPPQAGNNHPTSIPTGVFHTSDGYINIACSGEHMWRRLCQVLGADDLAEDPSYSDGKTRLKNRDALNETLDRYTSTRSTEEWVEALNSAGVPCGPIYSIDETFADPQVQHLGMCKTVEQSVLGRVQVVDNAVRLSAAPDVPYSATPERGQHTDEILSEFGYAADEIASLRERDVL
jgi:formyl-CoA transferase